MIVAPCSPDVPQPAWQVWPGPGTRAARLKKRALEPEMPETEMLLKYPNDVALDAAGVRILVSVFVPLSVAQIHGAWYIIPVSLLLPGCARFHIVHPNAKIPHIIIQPMILSQLTASCHSRSDGRQLARHGHHE